MEVTRDDKRYVVADGHESFWTGFADGSWEPATFKIFDKFLKPDRTFVDIGAWIGPTVLYAAPKANKVFAFEPDHVAYKILCENLYLNKVENVIPYPVAVANMWKGIKFGSRGSYGDSMSSELWAKPVRDAHRVPAVSLESILLDLQPNFVKIDIEGGERTIFDTSRLALLEVKPTIHLSLHTPWFPDADELRVPIMETLSVYPYFYDENLNRIDPDGAFDPNAFNSIVATFKEI